MSTRDSIVDYLKKRGSTGSKELSKHLGISRQALNVHFKTLINSGEITRTGATRNTRYHHSSFNPAPEVYKGDFSIAGLDENRVYQRAALSLNLTHNLKPGVEVISHYAFTEMLNNAIDHSESGKVRVVAELGSGVLKFEIKDWGIGVFFSLAHKLGYPDEHDAMVQLIKGKTTTMPEAHSGEGIFFTSKAADRMVLRSHHIQLEWHRGHQDVFVSSRRFMKGTQVSLEIQRGSRTKLAEVFARFAPEKFDYQFAKTLVQVKLLEHEYISRSEARRLLLNLDKFKAIELDFNEVNTVGQGFTDEIFRVWACSHPEIEIKPINANQAVTAMIRHAGVME
jgi:DNA-binding Lrp family transcriptional regulator